MTAYHVRHLTEYRYTSPVPLSHHLLHLEPRSTERQRLHAHALSITPLPGWRDRRLDVFGNVAQAVSLAGEHDRLVIEARSTVAVDAPVLPEPAATPAWEEVVAIAGTGASSEALDAAKFAFASPFTPSGDAVEAFARKSFTPGRPVLEAALELNRRIFEEFSFDATATTIATPVDDVLRLRRGVCQDFAHLLVASLRVMRLASRYVSGYLLNEPAPGQERLVGADASHAWVALWLPEFGWIDLDPTNNLMPTDAHVTLAWGRDYGDVSPVAGVIYGGGAHDLHVSVDVTPV